MYVVPLRGRNQSLLRVDSIGTSHVFRSVVVRAHMAQAPDNCPFPLILFGEGMRWLYPRESGWGKEGVKKGCHKGGASQKNLPRVQQHHCSCVSAHVIYKTADKTPPVVLEGRIERCPCPGGQKRVVGDKIQISETFDPPVRVLTYIAILV